MKILKLKIIMRKIYFKEINPYNYSGYTIIIDIDGTLCANGESLVGGEEKVMVEKLKEYNQIFVFSNNSNKARSRDVAKQIECPYLDAPSMKPNKKIIQYLPEINKPILVIGDRLMTDVFFAKRIKAEYVLVRSLYSKKDSLLVRLFCIFDDVLIKLFLRNY